MQVFTYNPTAPCIALARVGKRSGDRVVFSAGNSVEFRRKGNGYSVSQINNEYSFSLIMFTTTVDELDTEENTLLVAAMMVMGISSVMVGDNQMITLGAQTGIIHTVIIDSPIPQPIRHASNWDKAKEFGVSGHRHTESPRHTRTPAPQLKYPTTKKGWLGLAALAAVTVGAIVLTAACTED